MVIDRSTPVRHVHLFQHVKKHIIIVSYHCWCHAQHTAASKIPFQLQHLNTPS